MKKKNRRAFRRLEKKLAKVLIKLECERLRSAMIEHQLKIALQGQRS